MLTVTRELFVNSIHNGDVGLICGSNLFATLQAWYAKKYKEGPLKASHGFYVRENPRIIEANGIFVSGEATYLKNIGDKTKCWIFRYGTVTPEQVEDMNDYLDGMVDGGGHYSVMGIAQFALQFFGIRKKVAAESGVFCTELTGLALLKAKLPYVTDLPAYAVTPTHQLNWFMTEGLIRGYFLAGTYDGAGNYQIKDDTPEARYDNRPNPKAA